MPYNFHDAGLLDFTVGPRNEISLCVGLDDPNFPAHQRVTARLGGVVDLSEAADFLAKITPARTSYAYRARIDRFDYLASERQKEGRLALVLELDRLGQIVIACRNVTFKLGE